MGKYAKRFRERWRYYLRHAGYQQKDLLVPLDVDKSTLSRWVNGKRSWPKDALQAACTILDVNDHARQELFVLAGLQEPADSLIVIQEGFEQPTGDSTPGTVDDPVAGLPTVPLQIPASQSELFVGRENEIKDVMENLHPGQKVMLLGPGGIGKTEIAIEVVNRLEADDKLFERFPDGTVFYSFYGEGKENPSKVFEHICESYGVRPRAALQEAAIETLSNRQSLLILDGSECTDDLISVLDVVGRKCGVLIATQRSMDVPARGIVVEITSLTVEEATRILVSYAGKHVDKSEAISRVFELVSGLTLAICQFTDVSDPPSNGHGVPRIYGQTAPAGTNLRRKCAIR